MPKIKIGFLILSLLLLSSCPTTTSTNRNGFLTDPVDEDYAGNPEAREAMMRLTRGGTTFPSSAAFNREVGAPPCNGDCQSNGLSEDDTVISGIGERTRGAGTVDPNDISGFTEARRVALLGEIERAGIQSQPTTVMTIGGQRLRVMNDGLKLPNGQYVNLKYAEARRIAQRWGCRLPTLAEARAIRRHAEQQGTVLSARPHLPNDTPQRYSNMELMMNDSRMHEYSRRGNTELINGHFKWYIENGNNAAFYGFRACSPYCQNEDRHGNPSFGSHGNDYLDYSHSARFVCPGN